MASVRNEEIDQVARRVFGVDLLKDAQRSTCMAAMAGKDVLAVMPTGHGKSLCYQLPGVVLPGATIVVAPTVSLIKDQVDRLSARGLEAFQIVSSTPRAERHTVRDALRVMDGPFLILSPEMLASLVPSGFFVGVHVTLAVVDEVHCFHEWGTSFRPEYLRLPAMLDAFPNAVRMGLTASATVECRRVVSERLLRSPEVVVAGFDRKNVTLEVDDDSRVTGGDTDPALVSMVVDACSSGSSLVYRSSRKGAEDSCRALRDRLGDRVAVYHGGMETGERDSVHDRFMRGDVQVVCATSAFGMGVDKSDVASVFHVDLPPDLESYHQQNGRAGRSGAPSRSVLLRRPGDVARAFFRLRDLEGERLFRSASGLEWVMALVEAPSCRSRVVMWRFGQVTTEPCGHCDLCAERPETVDVGDVFSRFVSAIDDLPYDPPVGLLSSFAAGFRSEGVEKAGFDRRSGFGCLKTSVDGARRRIRQWLADGWLDLLEGGTSVLVSDRGRAQARSGGAVLVPASTRRVKSPAVTGEGLPERVVLAWRTLVALRETDPALGALTDADLVAIVMGEEPSTPLDETTMKTLRAVVPKGDVRPRAKGFAL